MKNESAFLSASKGPGIPCGIGEHIGDIRRGEDTPLVTHIWEVHGGQMDGLTFKAIKMVREPIRGHVSSVERKQSGASD